MRIKERLKKNRRIFSVLRNAKLKWQNYFAQEGEVPRKWYQFWSQFDKIFDTRYRRKVAQHYWKISDANTQQLVHRLNEHGYAEISFSELGIDSSSAYSFMEEKIRQFRENEFDENHYSKLDSGMYAGKALSYHLYKKEAAESKTDPLMHLVCHPKMIELASMYLGNLPLIGFTSLMFTPVHPGKQFGAQLWHRDLHHKRCLKLFFSPIELTLEQGPFEYFPPQFSGLKYYKYFPQSMTDEQIAEQGLDPMTALRCQGGRDKVLLVDTTRCLHRGGRTKSQPRYIATSVYCSTQHSFSVRKFKETEHYQNPFIVYKKENEVLKTLVKIDS